MRAVRTFILLFLLLLPCIALSQEEKKNYRFNFGIKAGFQALTYNDPEFDIEGYEFDNNSIQSSKIGYTISPFFRFTFHSFYLQTEATIGLARHSFEFADLETAKSDAIPGSSVYELKTYCIQAPLLFGYNFIDQRVFGMSVFTGPRLKYTLTSHSDQKFRNFRYDDLQESLERVSYYWEIGLGVKISNVFFDFVYDVGMNDTSKYLESKKHAKKFKSSRSDNILSFSVGVIF